MNLYQLYFTRTGRQEIGAGWKITAASAGTSKIAGDTFKGIASNLIELRKPESPDFVLDVREEKNFYFITHINYAAKGADARGNAFAHGMVLNPADFYEICRNPQILCGMDGACFETEHRGEVRELPVLNELPHYELDVGALLKKYGLDTETYIKLLKNAILAIENPDMPLYVAIGKNPQEKESVAKEIMFLIYCGLPLQFCMRLSFCTAVRSHCKICFSDTVYGENYFDTGTGNISASYSGLEHYQFFRDFDNIFKSGNGGELFERMGEFLNESFGYASNQIGCERMEIAYRYCTKALTIEEGTKFLTACLHETFKSYSCVDEYMAEYLAVLNAGDRAIGDKNLEREITKRFGQTQQQELAMQYCVYYGLEILRNEDTGSFERLFVLRQSKKKEYEIICDVLYDRRPDFYEKYYFEYALPRILVSFSDIHGHLLEYDTRVNEKRFEDVLAEALGRILSKEAENTKNNQELCEVMEKAASVFEGTPYEAEMLQQNWEKCINRFYWKYFHLSDFHFDLQKEYGDYDVEKYAAKDLNAGYVKNLLELENDIVDGGGSELLFDLFFDRNAIEPQVVRKAVLKEIKVFVQELVQSGEKPEFDVVLGAFYSYSGERFRVREWAKMLTKYGLSKPDVRKDLKNSILMNQKKYRNIFEASLTEAIADRELKKDRSDRGRKTYEYLVDYAEELGIGTVTEPDREFRRLQQDFLTTGAVLLAAVCMLRVIRQDSLSKMLICAGAALVISIAVTLVKLIWGNCSCDSGAIREAFEQQKGLRILRLVQIVALVMVLMMVLIFSDSFLPIAYVAVMDAIFMIVVALQNLLIGKE